tara:strand:+ start:568 stop:912 length:345 start_codon:yes stop_codon:yes gene_type:complete
MIKGILIACLFFTIGHLLIWFQLNGQFIWKVWKDNILLVSLIGIPASIAFITATKYAVAAFDGAYWPTRFIGFSIGIILYGFMINYFFSEGVSTKTLITLILALIIVLIQVFWK